MAYTKRKSMEEAKERVMTILKATECLRLDQVEKINYNNVVSTGVARKLVSERKAFYSKNKDRLIRYPWIRPNKAVTNCFDVVLKFIMNIDINNMYQPKGITNIGFTRAKKNFELVYVRNNKELQKVIDDINIEYNDRRDNFYDSTKYIICVPNEYITEEMPKDVGFKYAFAVISYNKELASPDIYFLTPDEEIDKLMEVDEEEEDE